MNTPAARQLDADDEAQLLRAIDKWIERDLKPIVREYDHADRYPTHVVEQMKELGLFGATVSAEYGGLDRGDRCDLEAGMAKYFASEAAHGADNASLLQRR